MTAIKNKPFAVAADIKGTATPAADDLGKVEALINQVKAILAADDVSLDTIQEVITRIKTDEGLITSLTTGKVNVADILNYYQAVTVATYADAVSAATGTQKKRITVASDTVNNGGDTSLYDWDGVNLMWLAAQKVN